VRNRFSELAIASSTMGRHLMAITQPSHDTPGQAYTRANTPPVKAVPVALALYDLGVLLLVTADETSPKHGRTLRRPSAVPCLVGARRRRRGLRSFRRCTRPWWCAAPSIAAPGCGSTHGSGPCRAGQR
jgi:hypothetical protein